MEWDVRSRGHFGGLLLGVVIEHPRRAGASTITALPLTMLESDEAHPEWGPGVADPAEWWKRLGVAGVEQLKLLPERRERPEPAYVETLREFDRRLRRRMPELLGRETELAEIASFASGRDGYRWLVGGVHRQDRAAARGGHGQPARRG